MARTSLAFSRARCVRVPDQFLLSRGGERATVDGSCDGGGVSEKEVVVAATAAALLWRCRWCGGGLVAATAAEGVKIGRTE